MKPARYMAQRMGIFGGLVVAYDNNLKKAIKKAQIQPEDASHEFGLYTVRNGGIVRITRNGKSY